MNVIGEKVKSPKLGVGTVIEQEPSHITVQFATKTSQFQFPDAFERFLIAEDPKIQNTMIERINAIKEAEAQRRAVEDAARKAEEESKQAAAQEKVRGQRKRTKSIDDMFSEDYHVDHLARHPILTYQQVEEQFGIKITGFGRGINVTPSKVVLISSISKAEGNFVYHDKWTSDGEYIYSGEGKTGDQAMSKGNLAIKNAAMDGKEIHLFVKFSPKDYYYQGKFELVSYTYEDEKGENGCTRVKSTNSV
ncbi:MAG: hypothetical protein ACLSA0_21210 [Eisenbergiella massiliensis]